ncbi:MAG: MoaD/ThiS family protein [Verrucomicrobiae bacterium]|nr:MoaD/ThiS family protein [Verrucomicrobiae bacterium]
MSNHADTITVFIPGPLRSHCGGVAELQVSAHDLRGVLVELEQQHPVLHRNIREETGAVRSHINLFVNNHHMRDLNGLDTSLATGDTVFILPAVSGG